MRLIIPAITAHGFTDEKYGTAFWQATTDSYASLLNEAKTIDGTVSNKVGAKNQLRSTVVKAHNALINVLRGN